MDVTYTPGSWRAVVTDGGIAVLDAAADTALVAAVRAGLADGHGLPAVLDALAARHPGAFSSLPPFAVVLPADGSVRVAVRGELSVAVSGASPATITGAGVTTWTETLVAGAERVTVSLPTGSDDGSAYPIRDGVVLVGALTVELRKADAASGVATEAEGADAAVADAAPVQDAPAAPVAPIVAEVPIGLAAPAPVSVPDDPAPEIAVAPADVPADPYDAPDLPGDVPSASEEAAAFDDVVTAHEQAEPPAADEPDAAEPVATASDESDEQAEPGDAASDEPYAGFDDVDLDATAVVETLGDHDGETISIAQAQALRAAAAQSDTAPPPLAGPRAAAPGRIVLSTGETVTLDRTVVIGRRPRSTRITGTDLPHLVVVDSPQQDISRSHLELRVEGGAIVATDLNTTNGSTLLRIGQAPVKLHPGEGTVVVSGDVIDLGDGITLAVEENG